MAALKNGVGLPDQARLIDDVDGKFQPAERDSIPIGYGISGFSTQAASILAGTVGAVQIQQIERAIGIVQFGVLPGDS